MWHHNIICKSVISSLKSLQELFSHCLCKQFPCINWGFLIKVCCFVTVYHVMHINYGWSYLRKLLICYGLIWLGENFHFNDQCSFVVQQHILTSICFHQGKYFSFKCFVNAKTILYRHPMFLEQSLLFHSSGFLFNTKCMLFSHNCLSLNNGLIETTYKMKWKPSETAGDFKSCNKLNHDSKWPSATDGK